MRGLGYWVYMAECADGSLYTGMTTDVERRERVHNAGKGAKYTRSRLPIKMVYREPCADKSAALKREAALKKLTHTEKRALIEGSQET